MFIRYTLGWSRLTTSRRRRTLGGEPGGWDGKGSGTTGDWITTEVSKRKRPSTYEPQCVPHRKTGASEKGNHTQPTVPAKGSIKNDERKPKETTVTGVGTAARRVSRRTLRQPTRRQPGRATEPGDPDGRKSTWKQVPGVASAGSAGPPRRDTALRGHGSGPWKNPTLRNDKTYLNVLSSPRRSGPAPTHPTAGLVD